MSVTELVQPKTACGLSDSVEQAVERAFWLMMKMKSGHIPMSERDAFKYAVREMFISIRLRERGLR